MARLIWAPKADRDLLDIWLYYASEASTDLADKITDQIVAAARRIGRWPLSGRSRDDVKPGLRSALANPYVVFYRISSDDVEIIRILHGSRNFVPILAEGDQPDRE